VTRGPYRDLRVRRRPRWTRLKTARKADSSAFASSYARLWGGGQMAVVRRETWWILLSLVAGILMGGGVMIYAATRVMGTP